MLETGKETGSDLLSVSQSLIKNYWDYREGKYCGVLFHVADLQKLVERVPTDRMKLGHYFEFLCTGATLRDGSEPETPSTSTGKPKAEAIRMQKHAERFKALVEKEGIEIGSTGVPVIVPFTDHGFQLKGIFDVIGTYKERAVIIDIKSSGLIGNEWEAYGWHASTFNMRKNLTIQVVFYKYLAWKGLNIYDMPFYFIIHSTTNETDSLFWEVKLNDFEVAMNHFEDMVFDVVDDIKLSMEHGFTEYPSVKRCEACPYQAECSFATTTPNLETVTIDGIFE